MTLYALHRPQSSGRAHHSRTVLQYHLPLSYVPAAALSTLSYHVDNYHLTSPLYLETPFTYCFTSYHILKF